ncbi:hypothetical protein GGR39_002348 [Novosphingobium fluoreni]|uniref:Bacteriophage tail tape measure N-terminal domain-containing protein n=1 Tax=Novosphingobium fluoreni TaxID=1391222 RepID=A0A7W6C6Z9_9SPHN|nr:phage tail length tape measure family protein [Novosphingobium fluoreni]MBB3940691.1 hypothetical protein [Novosphingobium fluoreni]
MANAVAIRIGTTGKTEVKNDFGEIKTAGTGAMQSIAEGARKAGDIGEQQAQRLAASYERATEDMLAADRRRAAAAQKLAAVTPQSSVQQVIAVNTGTGFNDNTKSARESAIIMAQLIDEQERYTARVNQFRAAIDPAFAAQQRFDNEMAEARTLIASGGISLDQYCQKLRLETALLEETATAQNRAGAGAGAHRAAMQGLSYQVQDTFTQLSMGANVFQVLAIQGGQAAGQFANLEGKAGRVASFFIGPWGLAITGALLLFGPFVTKLLEGNDALDDSIQKLKEEAAATDVSTRAKAAYNATLDGQIARQKEMTAQLDRQLKSQREVNQEALISRQNDADDARKSEAKANAAVTAAEKKLAKISEGMRNMPLGADDGYAASIAAAAAKAEKDLARARTDLTRAQKLVADTKLDAAKAMIPLARDGATAASDPTARINRAAEDAARAAEKRAVAEGWTQKYLEGQLTAIERQKQVKLAEVQASSRSASSSGQANLGDMVALVKQLFPGARITSTNGGKHTSGSDHYADRAIDFVPAGGMGRYTTDEVESILRDAGVDIRRGRGGKEQMFGPGRSASKPGDHDDHFHFAWQGSASPEAAERRRAAAAEKAERERDQAARRVAALAGMSADLDDAILNAKRSAITDGAALAQFAKDQVRIEGDKYAASLASKVETEDITAAQRDELMKKRAVLDGLKVQQIDTDEAARKAVEALTLQSAANDNQRDLLNGHLSLATTTRERLPLAMSLLGLDQAEERLRLQAIIDREKIGKATAAEADAARTRLGQLDQIYGARAQATARENESPMQAYLRDISTTGAQMNEQLESVGVNGLRSFTEELSDAIVNFESLGNVAKHVLAEIAADLIKMQLRKGIAGLVTGALGALGGAAKLSGVNFGAIADAANSVSPTILGHASGTEYFSGGTALVGEQGRELVELPAGSKIHNASATRRMLANDNGPSFHMPITIDARGADAAGLARVQAQLAQMEREMPERAIAAVQEYRERNHLDRGRAA